MSKPKPLLRLTCVCGRNLADVTRPRLGTGMRTNPQYTSDGLSVRARPGVDQTDFRPWPADPDADMHERTYSWKCTHCPRTPTVRHERISAWWQEASQSQEARDTPLWLASRVLDA